MLVVRHNFKNKWNRIIKSFSNWDVYYLHEYAMSLMKHGDGEPLLFYYEDVNCRFCYVTLVNDISKMKSFENDLLTRKYFDLTTPYGYGGPIIEGDFNTKSKNKFIIELYNYCVQNNIISQFIRFHPLLNNQRYMKDLCEIVEIKKTIAIDTMSYEIINSNMISKSRNMIRKAKKQGVSIKYDTGEQFMEFIRIYELTMKENQASSYYFFEQSYYDYLINEMSENTIYFYAYVKGRIVSAAIFFYNDKYMHYHLSGVQKEYRHMASMNLLLSEAAFWATERGIELLHLGGGVGDMDSLYKFKKQFNRNDDLSFYIGRNIFNLEAYNELLDIRERNDENFDRNNSCLIQYRKE